VIDVVEIRFDIPDALHHKLKVKAANQKKTLKELVIEMLEGGIKSA
jgi:predicted HicB family RNase H-like nuclease